MFIKKENGITLIALAVTVAVTAIIASILITASLGDHGNITKAKNAKEVTTVEQIKEYIVSAYVYAQGRKNSIDADLSSKIKSDLDKTYGTENVNVNRTDDKNGYEVFINNKKFYIDDQGIVIQSNSQ